MGKINTIDKISTKFAKIITFLKEGEGKQFNQLKAEIVEPNSLEKKQFNSYDCGMFVLEFAQCFIEYILNTDKNFSLEGLRL